MSRRGGSVRETEVVYDERERSRGPAAAPNRWDRERFDRERIDLDIRRGRGGGGDIDIRINERRGSSGGSSGGPPPPAPVRRPVAVEERERFYERDTYSPPGRHRDAYWEEPTPSEVARTALAPYRAKEFIREYDMPARGGRPGLLRRQSSLDTFDRKPLRSERRDEWRPPAYVPIPLPIRRDRRYDDFEEIRIRERERERDLSPGWEEEYRDVRVRRRGPSHQRRRAESVRSASSSSSSSDDASVSVKSEKSTKTIVPPMIGKKGKTRMPKRLVHKQAIIDMGLPFEEEEHFIIVQRALEKGHIDEIIEKSKGYKDTKVTYKYEEVKESGGDEEVVKEEVKETILVPPPLPPPPPGTIIYPPPPASIHSHHSHHSRSRHGSPAPSSRTEFVEEKFVEKVEERESRRPSMAIERIEKIDRRSERSIREEIRALEAEREALRLERRADRKLLEADRLRDGYDEYEIVERRRPVEEVIRVEKDRRGRRKTPDPKAVALAMSTLT